METIKNWVYAMEYTKQPKEWFITYVRMTKKERAKHCVKERLKQCPTINLKRQVVMKHLVPCDCWEDWCHWRRATEWLRNYHNLLVKRGELKEVATTNI